MAAIIVHGGAGRVRRPEKALLGCEQALDAGWATLSSMGSALDAVEAAVRSFEDNPWFNAGRGSSPTRDGGFEMDAIIMDGSNLEAGAVGCLENILHPVSVARRVMEKTRHVLLVGRGANQFANDQGFQESSPDDLRRPDLTEDAVGNHDTVGAVALDDSGNLAVATSTGGLKGAMPGRVGDSPILGAGAYADNGLGAGSATGIGEQLMRVLICRSAVDLLVDLDPMTAAAGSIDLLESRVNGAGGIILLDPEGRPGWAFNTQNMSIGYRTADAETVVEILTAGD